MPTTTAGNDTIIITRIKGSSVTMECPVSDKVNVTWTRDGGPVSVSY